MTPGRRSFRFAPRSLRDSDRRPAPAPEASGLYEKFELHVDLKASYTNPFDPDQIDLWAEFTSPSGKPWRVCGFYNPSSWSSLWMVRFAPTETGTWNYVVKVKDSNGVAEGGRGRFEAATSAITDS